MAFLRLAACKSTGPAPPGDGWAWHPPTLHGKTKPGLAVSTGCNRRGPRQAALSGSRAGRVEFAALRAVPLSI